MNNSLIHIDQYFNGELKEDEKKLFEERCLADPGFAKEVANYILMRDQAKANWIEQKKQDFAALEKEEGKGAGTIVPIERKYGQVKKINNWRQLSIAAATVGIIALGIAVYLVVSKDDQTKLVKNNKEDVFQNRDTTDTVKNSTIDTGANKDKNVPIKETDILLNEQLVAKNFKVDAPPKNTEGVLEDAFDDYKNGDYISATSKYDDAITMIEELDTRSADDEEEEKNLLLFYAHYYNGLSHFVRGNTMKAIAELKAIKKSPDKVWQNKVRWYLALAYLKAGKVKEAQTLLKQITDSGYSGAYKQKALNLLKDIK